MKRLGLWACLPLLLLAGPAFADVVRLRGGGEIRGQILDGGEGDSGTGIAVETLSGARVRVPSEEIDFVERRGKLVEEYVTRSRQIPETVQAHVDLADWCRTQQLHEQRREQLERVLDLDPDHLEARKVLGYVNYLGRWMTQEDMMAERGYLRHDGRWVTRQELELIEANSSQRESERSWMPKVRLWLSWATGSDPQRQVSGIAELQRIRDPDAVGALTTFLSGHQNDNVRMLFVTVLGQIKGTRPVLPLVQRTLLDQELAIRNAAIQALGQERYSLALPGLIAGLKHQSNSVICHAAEALAQVGDLRAVPALIDALVTRHSFQVQVPANNGISFTGGNSLGLTGRLPPNIEMMARAGQLPYGVNVLPDPSTPVIMKTVTVTSEMKNAPVLAALEKLTGKNLGFNEQDWHLWWAIQKG
jgi:hypothetical protein